MWVWSLGRQDPLELGTTSHSSILAWIILWTEESIRSQRVLSLKKLLKWQTPPTPSVCRNRVFVSDHIKRRTLGWTHIHKDCVLIKEENLETEIRHKRRDDMKTQGDKSHLQVKKCWGRPKLSQPSRGANHTTLWSDFQPPELWDNKCLLFKLLRLWYLVMAAPGS